MQGRSLSSVSLFSSASLPLDGGSQHLGSEQSARPRGQPVDGTVTATARAAALADFFDDVLSRRCYAVCVHVRICLCLCLYATAWRTSSSRAVAPRSCRPLRLCAAAATRSSGVPASSLRPRSSRAASDDRQPTTESRLIHTIPSTRASLAVHVSPVLMFPTM
ncbi:MAG: hypothetical protein MHM6MM_009256 [Cercozoa sp. M6MM]